MVLDLRSSQVESPSVFILEHKPGDESHLNKSESRESFAEGGWHKVEGWIGNVSSKALICSFIWTITVCVQYILYEFSGFTLSLNLLLPTSMLSLHTLAHC